MTRTRSPIDPSPLPERWNRPLLAFTAAMLILAAITIVFAVLDPREILGQNAWFKPLKFAISIAIYSLSLAWMISQVRRFRRLAGIGAIVVVASLTIEVIIIVGAAAQGSTSHFNVATAFNTALWVAMAITTVWIITLLVGIALMFSPGPDAARNLAIRAGVTIGLLGMAVAFFMTGPTPSQLNDFEGIAGAHAVGVADGGPGLPFFGWSTVAGDLRVPHFIGMHALQAIPLALLLLELLSRRIPVLQSEHVRFRLILTWSLTFAAYVGILTWQALSGEPVTAPSGATLTMSISIGVATVIATTLVIAADASRRRR